jgi:hypothetical protein
MDSSGALVEEKTYCDGAAPLVFSQRSCQVPMVHLRGVYGLLSGDLIKARV